MRRLMLLRHAKAAWPQGVEGGGIDDIDRPLAPRGQAVAPLMADYLKNEYLFPDHVVVSAALRTRQTWDLLMPILGEGSVHIEPRLYEASPETLLHLIQQLNDNHRHVLMIGHNPGFEDVARLLVGQGDRYAFARMAAKFPTCGLAVIDFDNPSWRAVTPRSGRLERFVTPHSLGFGMDD
jgi:phosphohistidine phosphatase